MTQRLFLALFIALFSLWIGLAKAGNEPYASLLKKVVRADGVRWDLFGSDEKQLLTTYMNQLADANLGGMTASDDQLAFWINAHNACVLKLLSEHMPADDVMKISGFRDRLTCKIVGVDRTIVEIQSGVIRPMFNEPRVHFVLWWGTKGGAKLADTPYEGPTLKKTLEERTKQGLADSRFVNLKSVNKEVLFSPIFDWFKSDFGTQDTAFLKFVKANTEKAVAMKIPTDMRHVQFSAFDWSLDQSKNQ